MNTKILTAAAAREIAANPTMNAEDRAQFESIMSEIALTAGYGSFHMSFVGLRPRVREELLKAKYKIYHAGSFDYAYDQISWGDDKYNERFTGSLC